MDAFETPFRLDRNRSASIQVFEHLRELIVTLAIKPRETLDRHDLASYYGLSSTPIRDALSKLGEEKLVCIYPQRATEVSPVYISSAKQAHFLRLSVELEVVEQLARQVTPQLTFSLRNFISQQELALRLQDFSSFAKLDMAFHHHMYVAAGVEPIWSWIRQQSGNLDRLRRLHMPIEGKAQMIVDDHKNIVIAIESGDGGQAASAVRQHLSGTLSQIAKIARAHPEYVIS